MSDPIVQDIISDWDEVYKKGQLTLWVLLAIADGDKYSQEIANFMYKETNQTLTVREQSLYRALRRFTSLKLVAIAKLASPDGGPDRKYYSLTQRGRKVLKEFTHMNIRPLQAPLIVRIINNLEGTNHDNTQKAK